MNEYLENIVKRDVATRDPELFRECFNKDGSMRQGKKVEDIAEKLSDFDEKTAVYQLWYPSSLQVPQVSAALEEAWKRGGIRTKYTIYIGKDRRLSAGNNDVTSQECFYVSKYSTIRGVQTRKK